MPLQNTGSGLSAAPFPYIKTGTFLFRFMSPLSGHFWPALDDLLLRQELHLNSRVKFNDPFDSNPVIIDDISIAALREYFQDMLDNPLNPKRSLTHIFTILNMKDSGKTKLTKKHAENIKAGLRRNASKVLDQGGLASFSLTAENPLLWGHYLAYRAFHGGFKTPQSRRMTGYGFVGLGIVALAVLKLIDWLFPNLL